MRCCINTFRTDENGATGGMLQWSRVIVPGIAQVVAEGVESGGGDELGEQSDGEGPGSQGGAFEWPTQIVEGGDECVAFVGQLGDRHVWALRQKLGGRRREGSWVLQRCGQVGHRL